MAKAYAGTIAISLVVATVGRVEEMDRLITSIERQTWKDFEVIIVDQNADDRVEALLASSLLSAPHIRVWSELGASKARNLGIRLAQGEIVGFPDDDCWYPTDLLANVKDWFDRHEAFDFFCCTARDADGQEVASRWPRRSQVIDRPSVLRACACSALFVRRQAALSAEGFDERMGPGPEAVVQAGEELDLVLRLMDQKRQGWFEKSLHIYHPRKDAATGSSDRAFSYGWAFGYLLRKHRYPKHTWLYHVARAIGGVIRGFFRIRPREVLYYWKSAYGRVRGYCSCAGPGAR